MRLSNWLLIAAAVASLVGMWQWLKPEALPAAPANSSAAMPVQVFSLQWQAGKLIGDSTLTLRQGEKVRIEILSDVADELHLHGYDHQLQLHPQQLVVLEFVADTVGRFALELHNSHGHLATLEVYPR